MQETQCDSSRIERFLDEQLGIDEEAAFESHLEVCAECRENLRAEAAQSPWWNNAGDFLSDDEFDVAFEAVETYAIDDATLEPRTADVSPRAVEFLDATDDPRMLGRFGGYEIAGIIGYGGMGIVLKGLDTALNRYAAIKVLSPLLATSGTARKRFAREARAAAAVLHENAVAIHGVSESHGLPFLVIVVIGLVGLSAATLVHRHMHDGHADVERDYSQGIAKIAAPSDEPFRHTIENVPANSAFAEVADTDTIPVEVAPPEQERTRQRHVTLEIRLADANPLPGLTKTALPDGDGFIYLHQEIIATNHQIKSVRVAHDAADDPAVSVTFTRAGERAIAKATEESRLFFRPVGPRIFIRLVYKRRAWRPILQGADIRTVSSELAIEPHVNTGAVCGQTFFFGH